MPTETKRAAKTLAQEAEAFSRQRKQKAPPTDAELLTMDAPRNNDPQPAGAEMWRRMIAMAERAVEERLARQRAARLAAAEKGSS
jgi:hypothetical protein